MPYFITDNAEGCDGWATVKDDGEVMGCHSTKQGAIDQALAIAQAEGSTFEGERTVRALPDNYRPAVSEDVPEGRACGNCVFYNEDRVNEDGIRVWCERWVDWVRGDHYCNAWQADDEDRQVDLTIPDYIREAARQGLAYHEEGLSGDGVVARTIREARLMAEGQISEDKVVRVSAWAARHRADLDADGARPGEDGYPTPGAVAHLLWGIPTGARYSDAVAWFDRKSEQVKANRSSIVEVTPVKPRTKGSEVEFRSFVGELRAEGDGNTFVGYAAVFDSPSQPLPFIERIAPGAFAKTLRDRKRDIRLYVNHDSNLVLASRRSGTLRLSEDDRGLRVEADLPDTTAGRDIRELMRTGVVDKMSFGFQVDRRGDKWSDDGMERTLTSVRLFEVSIVTGFPAYEQTTAAVRSLHRLSERTGMAVDELSEALDMLAEGAELPADKADLLLNAIKQSTPQPEPEPVNLLGLKAKQTDLLAKKVW
ncbi:MAG TPA: HK97 family phage prohead protease [Acidimicrobiia bacterium]